jgi:hypothetical protein
MLQIVHAKETSKTSSIFTSKQFPGLSQRKPQQKAAPAAGRMDVS